LLFKSLDHNLRLILFFFVKPIHFFAAIFNVRALELRRFHFIHASLVRFLREGAFHRALYTFLETNNVVRNLLIEKAFLYRVSETLIISSDCGEVVVIAAVKLLGHQNSTVLLLVGLGRAYPLDRFLAAKRQSQS